MRVLIIKVSALGDVVHALPVLHFLHQVSPGIEIDWVVEEGNRDVLEGNPLIRKVHAVRTRAWRNNFLAKETRQEISALWRELKARSFDFALDLQGNLKSGLITFFSGAGDSYGFDRNAVRELPNLLLVRHKVSLRPEDYHISDRALRVAGFAIGRDHHGMTLSTEIFTSKEDDAAAAGHLASAAGHRKILFHPGTTWETKLWHEDGWVRLGQEILKRLPQVDIFFSWGNERERGMVERINAGLGERATILPRVTVKQFAALLKQIDVVVGGDTGPVHLAAAVGTPTVSFYRVTDGRRNGPRGDRHILIQSPLPCTHCLRKSCEQDDDCRRSITAEMLLAGVEQLLQGGEKPH